MHEYRIKIMNRIAAEGLALLGPRYRVSAEEPDPHGILVRSSTVDTADYPSLLAVARAGAGVNAITVDQATGQGICVFNTPGANANAVAELVFIMLGINARNIHRAVDFCRGLAGMADSEITRQVEGNKAMFRGFELAGKTLGVLGLGKIGVRVANLGVRQGMRVVGFDPSPALENIHQLSPEVTLARSLGEVLNGANVLSLHMPVNAKTRGLVNGEFIEQLPVGAILVNYARGPIVEDDAVFTGLTSGRLAGYITDFPSAALLAHPKVLSTPHLGASTEESEEHCACMAVSELKAYLEYGTVSHSVNFPTTETIPGKGVRSRLIMVNRDVPGMIGFASHALGAAGLNIANYLNKSNGVIGYNIIDLEDLPDEGVLAKIAAHEGVLRTRLISF